MFDQVQGGVKRRVSERKMRGTVLDKNRYDSAPSREVRSLRTQAVKSRVDYHIVDWLLLEPTPQPISFVIAERKGEPAV